MSFSHVEESPNDLPRSTRRQFLSSFAGAAAGAALAATALPEALHITADASSRLTNKPAGNASAGERINESCPDVDTDQEAAQCYLEFFESPSTFIGDCVVAPVVEETGFRGIPSLLMDRKLPDDEALNHLVFGTEKLRFSRRELLVGAISSLLFGAAHNVSPKGINTEVLPTPQVVSGMYYWGLARKFGLPSSMLAHGALNYTWIRRSKAQLRTFIKN